MILEEPRLPATLNQRLHFRHADVRDLQSLSRITANAFDMPDNAVDWYTEKSLTQPDHLYYIGEVDGVVVGKIDVHHSKDASSILASPFHRNTRAKVTDVIYLHVQFRKSSIEDRKISGSKSVQKTNMHSHSTNPADLKKLVATTTTA